MSCFLGASGPWAGSDLCGTRLVICGEISVSGRACFNGGKLKQRPSSLRPLRLSLTLARPMCLISLFELRNSAAMWTDSPFTSYCDNEPAVPNKPRSSLHRVPDCRVLLACVALLFIPIEFSLPIVAEASSARRTGRKTLRFVFPVDDACLSAVVAWRVSQVDKWARP